MFNTPDSPAKTPVGYTTQGGNFWTLITPEIWKVLHAVLQIKTSALLGPRPVARTRVMLSENELKIILPLLPKMGVQNALMAKILLGTAVRLGELVGAKWENVDFENKAWFIPPTDIKGKKGKARNGDDVRGFIVPLTDSVLKWFSDLKELAFQSDYVLPIRSRKKAVGDAHMEAVTLKTFCNL
jgi:integrase